MNDEELGYARQRARMRNLEHVPGTNERNPDYRPPSNNNGSTGCLPAATRVATPTGLRPVGDVSVGTEVLAYDPESGRTRAQTVIGKTGYGRCRLVEVTLDRGVNVTASVDHSFLVDGDWIRASRIRVGSTLLRHDSTGQVSEAKVTSVAFPADDAEVFKLVVDEDFTIMPEGVVSHSFSRLRGLQASYWRLRSALGLSRIDTDRCLVNASGV